MHSNKQNPVEVIGAGDIGAGVGFKDIRTGDTLCDEDAPIVLESMEFPDPVIGIAVEPKTRKIWTNCLMVWLNWLKKTRHLLLRLMSSPVRLLFPVWVSFIWILLSTV